MFTRGLAPRPLPHGTTNFADRASGRGFTLVEAMMVLLIASIVIAIASPPLQDAIASNTLATRSAEFYTALVTARSEALKRNVPVAVCKSADGVSCTTSGGWEQGWIVFPDGDGNGSQSAGETALHNGLGLDGGYSLRAVGTGTGDQVTFYGDGSASAAGTFVFCDQAENLDRAREVRLSLTGRPTRYRSTPDCTP
jgi:type IV fimbrial biogenesis protein FimT